MSSPHTLCRPRGVALVIVLAFVVLLTGLMVAFFTRAMLSRQLANSSSGQSRAALLARSAADTVIAGFKSEIAGGSTAKSYNDANGSPTYTVYTPTVPPTGTPAGVYAVPVRYPVYTSAGNQDPIPNLVRESKRNDNANGVLPTPATPSFASPVNSSTDSAIGGRSVTLARWNSHYLIPSQSTPTVPNSAPDSTYVSFVAPDWVLVNRAGPAVVADNPASFSGTGAINNAATANANFVVGRYAYAVYDEGGLLDMNVAGHPTPATPAATTGFTATQVGQRGSLALADLTQLPIVNNPASASDYLPQTVVDQIMGWRNYVSAGMTAAYPSFSFSSSQAANWFKNFASGNTNGFLKVNGGATTSNPNPTGPTDQAFLSRQELLKLRSSLNFSANVLQYMGTFSRGIEQPSYVPAHIRYPANNPNGIPEAPNIDSLGSKFPPPAGGPEDGYIGNNDQVTTPAGSASVQDVVNPSFLTVRVKKTFTRADQRQTTAVVGEPLVKKKFPLSRLAEIRYDASDTTASITAALTSATFTALPNNTGAHNHIYDWFGLQRSSPSSPWTYNHTTAALPASPSTGSTPHIMTLQEVANLQGSDAREPDFAELLKAAINAGSLGKGGPNLPHATSDNYQYVLDVTLDYQVLQIMANLIDQYDTDSYPTIIQIAAAGYWRTFRGVEDLPYFYRYHPFSVITQLPSPLLSSSDTVTFSNAPSGNNNPSTTVDHCATVESKPFQYGGQMVGLYIPEVWNPHDYYTRLTATTGRPTRFRLSVITADPAMPNPQTIPWETGVESLPSATYGTVIPPQSVIPAALRQLTDTPSQSSDSTAFTFSDDNGNLFREPTLLWRGNTPTNINLKPDTGSVAGPYVDINLKNALGTAATESYTYYGVHIGQGPISFTGTVDSASYPANPSSASNTYVFQATQAVAIPTDAPTGSYLQYTFRLQYADPNNPSNWITYDEKYPDIHGMTASTLVVNTADSKFSEGGNNPWLSPFRSNSFSDNATGYDPRTARFGIGTESGFNEGVEPQEAVAAAYFNMDSAPGNLNLAKSNLTVLYTQRAFNDLGDVVNYSNPAMASDANGGNALEMRWFSGRGYSASATASGNTGWPKEYDGILFAQNDPTIFVPQRGGAAVDQHLYYEDPDGVARRGMGAYAYSYGQYSSGNPTQGNYNYMEGLPLGWADRMANSGIPTGSAGGGATVSGATIQNESRPFILNRPFRSVAEMSYASRGEPWKQLDFFTPESGDTALLDVFCINETPPDSMVAGKVNLNTHQAPVLQAMVAGTTRDEVTNLTSVTTPFALNTPSYSTGPAMTNTEAASVATALIGITKNASNNAWEGPLLNVGDLVGRYVNLAAPATASDLYTFNETATGRQYSYAGLSPAMFPLPASPSTLQKQTYRIQRMHESAIRALADGGQTRVWNLLIDVVAQTGRYSSNATKLAQFSVDGESRYWMHVAIDRYTGAVLDKQIEVVTE